MVCLNVNFELTNICNGNEFYFVILYMRVCMCMCECMHACKCANDVYMLNL